MATLRSLIPLPVLTAWRMINWGSKRVSRILKVARKYLRSLQKSVLAGDLTDRALGKLKAELEPLIDPSHDSIILFCCPSATMLTKIQIGLAGDGEPSFL